MLEKQTYQVAGHTFAIENYTQKPILSLMEENYLPFVVGNEQVPLFTLRIVQEMELGNIYPEKIEETKKGETVVDIYRSTTGRVVQFGIGGVLPPYWAMLHFTLENSVSSVVLGSEKHQQIFGINNAIMLLFMIYTAPLQTVMFHSSVIEVNQKGYLFLGKSGTGKSTHSKLWLNHIAQSELLNDDNPIVRIIDGRAIVYGSPWSGKTPCYKNKQVEVGAIVRLSQAPVNEITQLTRLKGYASILPTLSNLSWERTIADGIHNTVSLLVETTKTYHLHCLPNKEAATLCYQTVK